jgi:hypothetical protein
MTSMRVLLRRLPLSCALFVSLGAAELVYSRLPAGSKDSVSAWASTNVHRLSHEPLGPLVVSGFVVEQHRLLWLALAGAASVAVELRLGWLRSLLVLVSAHVVGTLLSEGILWLRVQRGDLPLSALRIDDVGPSYLVVGLLGAAVVLGPGRVRCAAVLVLGVLSPGLLEGVTSLDVTALGHIIAVATGSAVAYWVSRTRPGPLEPASGDSSTARRWNRLVR